MLGFGKAMGISTRPRRIDVVDIPLFLNCPDIFAGSILLSCAELFTVIGINTSLYSTPWLGPLKLIKRPRRLLDHLR